MDKRAFIALGLTADKKTAPRVSRYSRPYKFAVLLEADKAINATHSKPYGTGCSESEQPDWSAL